MFGGHRRLLRDGETARAVVTSAERHGGQIDANGGAPVWYRLGLRVHYPDGTTADASCKVGGQLRSTALLFSVGDIVPVRHDGASPGKVVVDEPALESERDAERRALDEAAVQRAERRLAGLPDVDPAALPTDDQLLTALRAWRERSARAKQAKAAHRRAVSDDLPKGEILRLLHTATTRTAEERTAHQKFQNLHRLRPDWTSPPEDRPH
ncbi:hypothetical protein [Streptacidiphilus jiangxiensis]|uniref:Uncharacterized protein n=1 Tax=Streptacidiphilus jiangxiensis TaxID=235985 RepID=A0A1H7PE10_STRJI|nr:hypothetical protein [Streptacidiphilus jiangxiensis]SEL33317.1 hypothetical protein SAMN05414137_107316 [Streptacidiphilus jiangxiensis]